MVTTVPLLLVVAIVRIAERLRCHLAGHKPEQVTVESGSGPDPGDRFGATFACSRCGRESYLLYRRNGSLTAEGRP